MLSAPRRQSMLDSAQRGVEKCNVLSDRDENRRERCPTRAARARRAAVLRLTKRTDYEVGSTLRANQRKRQCAMEIFLVAHWLPAN
jgi:hypothetical protein